ncbi:recombinase family protein [Blastopirellula sp. J2-11]|uniref:recombinase family protein n=1 Tax=Blastopirellula sp. J2-11 TaxID=2943192 RepID=UPI0021C7A12A|nr:recombinase family protein [Blastopirellula sp. J2-11]UUO05000.1 recombinase family protein [Blastopirellula sp. J2-11]
MRLPFLTHAQLEIASLACYCRVSTRRQKTASQRAEIESWLQSRGLDPSSVWWFEDIETGKKLDRPAFERLQQAVASGKIRTIVVWKLDRVSRRLKEGVNLLAEWCESGVRIVSVTEQIDLSGPVGRMIASVMFGLAEIELEFRRERQAAGIRLAKKNRVYQGRRPGTTKAKPLRAHELRKNGLLVAEISQALGVSERTVFRYLADEPSSVPS